MEENRIKCADTQNIYHPLDFAINDQDWLFYDIFIQGDSVVGIGPFEPNTVAKYGIDYHKVYFKFDQILIKGKVVKDPHNHTLIMRFSSRELTYLLKQSNELVCTMIAGTIERKFNLKKPVNTGKGRLCLSTLQKNEYEYISTWIDYHQKIGVTHFYIYDNASDDFERLLNLLRPYFEKDMVTIIK